jgi:hypothetical protein
MGEELRACGWSAAQSASSGTRRDEPEFGMGRVTGISLQLKMKRRQGADNAHSTASPEPSTHAADFAAKDKDFERMMQMLTGYCVTQIAGAVAAYSIADHLAKGPATAEQIAAIEGSDSAADSFMLDQIRTTLAERITNGGVSYKVQIINKTRTHRGRVYTKHRTTSFVIDIGRRKKYSSVSCFA